MTGAKEIKRRANPIRPLEKIVILKICLIIFLKKVAVSRFILTKWQSNCFFIKTHVF